MLYLNTGHLEDIGTDWDQLIEVIRDAVKIMAHGDFSQPIKPYLRYGDQKNRIIAMPAYIGGGTSLAGIKWIASFPDNIHKNRPRAHSVTILNQHDSGMPVCAINATMVSAVRTAAVSGLLVKEFVSAERESRKFTVSIIGFGPIGRMHLSMVESVLGNRIKEIRLFDIRGIDASAVESSMPEKIVVCNSWSECYDNSDIFITCTVSDKPYVDKAPRKASLQLNVSLRDYKVETRQYMDMVIVDDWEEVCRQNTDIENMHKQLGLKKEDTYSIVDVACGEVVRKKNPEDVVMFNPMGMAVFDIAIGGHYYREALNRNVGMMMPA
jgi:N-[(2S)-2-amino-2-carboxyethyl]-L-glutamate dehydrogenase